MKYYVLIALLIFLWQAICAQSNDIFKEDLAREMGYKTTNPDVKDRGLSLFQKDMQRLLRRSKVLSKKELFFAYVHMTIEFSKNTNGGALRQIKMQYTGGEQVADKEERVIKKIVEKLMLGWNPAIGKEGSIDKIYWVNMRLWGNPITVDQLRLEPTTEKSKLGMSCFQLYNIERDNDLLKHLFLFNEINAEYKGGMAIFCQDMNTLLDTASFSVVNRIQDSCTIDFIVNKEGKFGLMDTYESKSEHEHLLLRQLKQLSCNWLPAIISGRPLNSGNKYQFIFSYVSKANVAGHNPQQLRIEKIKRLKPEPVIVR